MAHDVADWATLETIRPIGRSHRNEAREAAPRNVESCDPQATTTKATSMLVAAAMTTLMAKRWIASTESPAIGTAKS
jgi:hypothetical protein